MKLERISSLHEDLLTPKATEHLGEYRDYPERFDPKDKSVLDRLEQFGIDLTVASEVLGKEIGELSWEEYTQLVAEAIKARYDVVVGSVFDKYVLPNPDDPASDTRWREMMGLVEKYEYMGANCGVNLIKRRVDFQEGGVNLILGLEAGANLIQTHSDLRSLVGSGIKLFGLQYGKDTPLATSGGLTKFGREAVQYMLDSNLIIDLAHAGYQTRQQVIEMARDLDKGFLVSYTHGSTEDDIMESWKGKIGERALRPAEVEQIIKIGGIIGLGVTQPFFSSAREVAQRINDVAQLEGGIDHVAIGTDFGGVPPVFMNEIKNPDDLKILADILVDDFNISNSDVNKVLRSNAREWLTKAIN